MGKRVPRAAGPFASAPSPKQPSGKGSREKLVLPDWFSRDEVRRLLEAPSLDYPTGLRNRCMLELMYRSGLRVGELVALRPRDVDVDAGTIRIEDGKGGDGTAYFSAEPVRRYLEEWIRERRRRRIPATTPLFCTLQGGEIATDYVRRMMKRMGKRAGLTGPCHPHMLRHSFATELLDEGFNLRQVQLAMRHKNITTTERYTHVLAPDLRDMIQRRAA